MLLPKGPDTIDKLDLDQNEKLDPDQNEKLDPDQSEKLDPDQNEKLDPDQSEKLDPDQSEKLDPDPYKLKWIRIPELRSLVLNYIQHLTSKSLGSGSGLFFTGSDFWGN